MMTKSKPNRLQKKAISVTREIIPASPVDRSFPVIAQDRPTPEDFSNPEILIKTGDVDFILPLDKIAPQLMELVSGGGGLKNGRATTKRRMPAQALAKLVTPCLAARMKAAIIQRRK
jgi:hypothetical protein